MDKTAKTIVGVLVVLIVIGGIYALSRNKGDRETSKISDSAVAGDTYKVGVLLPLTGDAAGYGEPARNVYQIAVDEVNAKGDLNKKLELVVEDSKCNGKDAANAAQKLINADKVQIILGGFCSSESLATVPVAEAARVALFSAASSSPDLTGASKYFFRNYPSDASQGSVLAEVVYNKEGRRKVAVLQEQQDYALGVFKAFETKFKSLGGEIVKEEFAKDATDVRSQLTKLKGANPDALFVDTQTPPASQRVFKQLQDMQWNPKLIINDVTTSDQETVAKYATLMEGAIGAEFTSDITNPKLKALADIYQTKYGKELPYMVSYGATEYDAIYMIKDAIKAVGYNGEKLADWGHKVSNWPGASGSLTIGSDGDRVGAHTAKVIKTGKVEVYK